MTFTIPAPLEAFLASAFPTAPVRGVRPTVGGFSNLSFFAQLGRRACVVKAAQHPIKREDLRREAEVLTLLRDYRFGTPIPLGFCEDDDWSMLVMSRRQGIPGMRLYSSPVEQLAAPLHALGTTLARLHTLAMPVPTQNKTPLSLLAERTAWLCHRLQALPLPDDLCAPLLEAAQSVAEQTTPRCLVHGDAGLHNILWHQGSLALLDWELASWGDARLDLAWVGWTLRFRGLPHTLWETLVDGYGEHGAVLRLDKASERALVLTQVASLLVRASERPAWDEWLRRARWSLEQYN